MSPTASTIAAVAAPQPGQGVQPGLPTPALAQAPAAAAPAPSVARAGPASVGNPGQAVGETLDLRDIHLPAEPGFWPPAPGWWLLIALGLILMLWLGRLGWARYRRWRRRQRILGELDQLQAAGLRGPALIAEVSALLKRVALTRYPRTQVAALTGDAWLLFLDRTGGDGQFTQGAGKVLAEGAYAPASERPEQRFDGQTLLALARDWLRRNS